MSTLLLLHTSLNGPDSLSSALANDYVKHWQTRHPRGRVITRDLADKPVPHLDAQTFAAFTTPSDQRDGAQQDAVALSNALVSELKAADQIVLAVPMHNFGIPSTLKAYIDHIARAGVTFRYTANGPVGLLTGKAARIFATRGGRYQGTPLDTQTPFLRNFLAFLGIENCRFVYAEGTAMGDAIRHAAVADARAEIAQLALQAA